MWDRQYIVTFGGHGAEPQSLFLAELKPLFTFAVRTSKEAGLSVQWQVRDGVALRAAVFDTVTRRLFPAPVIAAVLV